MSTITNVTIFSPKGQVGIE